MARTARSMALAGIVYGFEKHETRGWKVIRRHDGSMHSRWNTKAEAKEVAQKLEREHFENVTMYYSATPEQREAGNRD